MTSEVQTISPVDIYGGDPFKRLYRFKDAEEELVDVSEMEIKAEWISEFTGKIIPFSVDDSNSENGEIILGLTGEQTESMNGPGRFDLQATIAGEPVTFFECYTKYKPGVTRA